MPKSQTYLVTGGAGFIGSHLCEDLLTEGHTVLAIDDLSTGSMENIQKLLDQPKFEFTRANINDVTELDRLSSRSQVIVHLAAAVGVKLIVEHPVRTIETNIMGTEVVLKSALKHRCKVLLASTSEVYGKGTKIPFSEEDDVLLGPTHKNRWSYAASKMVDEFLGFAYQSEYDLKVVNFRLFNTVGPRQTGRYGMVVPRFVKQALKGEDISIYGDGEQSRCFCHVKDVVKAIIGLSQHNEAPGRVFNIGGTHEVSIRELAEQVIKLTGSSSKIEKLAYEDVYGPNFEDMRRRVPNVKRIHDLLRWEPRYSLTDILEHVIKDSNEVASVVKQ